MHWAIKPRKRHTRQSVWQRGHFQNKEPFVSNYYNTDRAWLSLLAATNMFSACESCQVKAIRGRLQWPPLWGVIDCIRDDGIVAAVWLPFAVRPIWPAFWKCQVCNEWSALQIQDRDEEWWIFCMHNCDWHQHPVEDLCVRKKEGLCVSTLLLVLVSEAIEENRDCKLLFFISFMCQTNSHFDAGTDQRWWKKPRCNDE